MKDIKQMEFLQYVCITFDDVVEYIFTVTNLKSFVCLILMLTFSSDSSKSKTSSSVDPIRL